MQLRVIDRAYDTRFVEISRLETLADLAGGGVESILGTDGDLADKYLYIDLAVESFHIFLDDRELWRQRYIAVLPGSRQQELLMPRWPAEAEALSLTSTTHSIDSRSLRQHDPRQIAIYRDGGWPSTQSSTVLTGDPIPGTELDEYVTEFTAGYLMPGQIDPWVTLRVYLIDKSTSVGDPAPLFGSWVKPSDPTNPMLFEVETEGISAGTEPDWPNPLPWVTERAYALGDFVVAKTGPIHLWFEATVGGTSGTTEPAWELEDGDTVTDGEVAEITWTTRVVLVVTDGTVEWAGHLAQELPKVLQELAAAKAIKLAKRDIGEECEDEDCKSDFLRILRFAA